MTQALKHPMSFLPLIDGPSPSVALQSVAQQSFTLHSLPGTLSLPFRLSCTHYVTLRAKGAPFLCSVCVLYRYVRYIVY